MSDDKPVPHGGLFITAGMQIQIPAGGLRLTVGPDGKITGELTEIHTSLSMCPRWLTIAYEHLLGAEKANDKLMAAYAAGDETSLGKALEQESSEGMQAIASSCTAVEAFYSSLLDHVKLDPATQDSWKRNRTARYKRIAEVLRRAFVLSPEEAASVRDILRQGFDLRDRAVHPVAKMARPMAYEAINRVTDWRYVCFRSTNAKMVVEQFLAVIAKCLPVKVANRGAAFDALINDTSTLIDGTLKSWNERYGPIGAPVTQ